MEINIFGYKNGNSFLHRMSVGIKLLLLIVFSVGIFFVSPHKSYYLMIILPVFLFFSPSVKDTLNDIKPIVLYSVFLCIISAITVKNGFELNAYFGVLPLIIRIILIGSATSLVYRTTSPLQIRLALQNLENRICAFLRFKKCETSFANLFSLYLLFIGRIFKNLQNIEYALKARGVKNTPKKVLYLLPALFSVSFQDAYETSKALESRKVSH